MTLVPFANSTGNDFGFYDGGITTTPVTLSFFEAVGDESSFTARWATATEVGHVGFDLWVLDGERWRRLNEQLIRSEVGDSLDTPELRVPCLGAGRHAAAPPGGRRQGSQPLPRSVRSGQSYGHKNLAHERIDWVAIGREHAAKVAQRQAQARADLASGVNPALLLEIDTGWHSPA